MSGDPSAFLTARLDEDEQIARAAASENGTRWEAGHPSHGWDGGTVRNAGGVGMVVYEDGLLTYEEAEHIARWDPARVLAEVAKNRAILALLDDTYCDSECFRPMVLADAARRILAAVYAEHPDYQQEWTP